MAQNQPNSVSNPKTLTTTPKCSVEGCTGHCVAVYHNLDTQPTVDPLAWLLGRKHTGIRVYSGMCWKHQKWDVFKSAKIDMYASGQIPLHSKLVL